MEKGSPHQTGETPAETNRSWSEIAPYAWLSLAGLAISVSLAILANSLVSHGLHGLFFLLAIVPLALSVASFLFGVLRGVAVYRGKHYGGTLELQGASVAFAGVMIAAFYFQPAANFPLTVYVHGSSGQPDLPLRHQGAVLLYLGGNPRSAPIGDKGEAFFPEVSASFRGRPANLVLDAPGYERSDSRPVELDDSVFVEVRRKPLRIAGNVHDENGKAIVGARISAANITTTSAENGGFDFVVPSDLVRDEMFLSVSADGYMPWKYSVIPDGGPVPVELRR
jgi:hypothetical protein